MPAERGRPPSDRPRMRSARQVPGNSRVHEPLPLTEMPEVLRIIADAEHRLAGTGRLLVRYSGNEMLACVMVKGEDATQIKTMATEIATAIRKSAGAS